MSKLFLIYARPRDPATLAQVNVRLAGGGAAKPYHRGGLDFRAGVIAGPRFSAELGFDDRGWTGGTAPTTAGIVFAPADPALTDQLAGYYWRSAGIEIDAGPEDGSLTRQLTGVVADSSIQNGQMVLTIADLSAGLDKPVAGGVFAGTGGIEGGTSAKGRRKRRSFGRVFNVEGKLLDQAYSIWEFGDPARPLQAFVNVRDKGRAGSMNVLAWAGSIDATLTALRAASVPQGGAVVAPSIACARWWTDPAGPLTADLLGEADAGSTAATIAAALLTSASGPALANAAAVAALRPAPVGLHISGEESTAEALDRLFLGLGCAWIVDPSGTVVVRPFSFDSPVEQLAGVFIERRSSLPPVAKRKMGWRKNERVHQDSEVSIAADLGTLEAVAIGVNQVINSEFRAGLTGFVPGWAGNTGLTPVRALTTDTNWTGVVQTAFAHVTGTPTASTGFDGHINIGDGSLPLPQRFKRWALQVEPGDRLYYSMLLGIHRCHGYTLCVFYDEDGNYVSEVGGNLVTNAAKDFYLGNLENAETSGAFATVPSSLSSVGKPARYAAIAPRAIMTGGTDPYLFFGRYFLAKVAAGQTVPPIYGPGPGNPRADVTGENTAADTSNVNGVPAATITANITQALTDAANAAALADSKIDTFYQTAAPSGASVGDLWFDTDDGNKQYRYSGSAWVAVTDARLGEAITAAATAQATADGKVTTYRQSGPPSGAALGDLWSDTDDDILYRWSGTAWQEVAKVGADGDPGVSPRVLTFSKASVALAADWNGLNVRGLPVSFKATLTEGGTDVSSSASWYIDAPTSGVSVSSNGTVTVSSISISGEIAVRAVYSSTTYSGKMPVTITKDPAPPQGNTSVFIDTVAISTSTSQPAAPNSGTALLTTTSAGQLVVSGGIDYNVSAGSGGGLRSFTAQAIVYYRIAGSGGSWTAFSAGAAVGYQARTGEIDADYINEPGGVYFDQVQGSLAASTEYEVGVAAWKHSGNGTAFDSVVGGITVALV
jgi:hypothetical protein